jgi:hypothetical protein
MQNAPQIRLNQACVIIILRDVFSQLIVAPSTEPCTRDVIT